MDEKKYYIVNDGEWFCEPGQGTTYMLADAFRYTMPLVKQTLKDCGDVDWQEHRVYRVEDVTEDDKGRAIVRKGARAVRKARP